jgi:signal transduction histidine kinase
MPVGSARQCPERGANAVRVLPGSRGSAPRRLASPTFSAPRAVEAENDQAQRAAIVGQLAGGILHDFNNILTVITGTIEILAEGVADRPQLAAIARLIDEAASRGALMATHLLAFARAQSSAQDEVDINALVAEAASLLRPTLGERIDFSCRPADELPAVVTDAGQLLAAILSLGIAIRDAMPSGGALTLHAGRRLAGAADAVTIVADAIGLADPAHPFELAFVERLVRRLGGELIVSGFEAGTSVEIVLPPATARDD